MGPEDRESGFPHGRGSRGPLLLTHDIFFGELQSSRSLDGITLSHRIASSPPEEVEVHTHVDAHFVLVTSGRYVSSARATTRQCARGHRLRIPMVAPDIPFPCPLSAFLRDVRHWREQDSWSSRANLW